MLSVCEGGTCTYLQQILRSEVLQLCRSGRISWVDMVLAPSVAGLFKWRQFEPEVSPGRRLVFALLAFLSRRGGTACRAGTARRSRHGVAMGPALRPRIAAVFTPPPEAHQRHFHRAFGRRRSDLQRGKRQSCWNQNEARKHSSTRRTVRYDRRWQIGHCCGSIGTDRTPVWIQVDRRRRLVACSADPDSRLRADHRESEWKPDN